MYIRIYTQKILKDLKVQRKTPNSLEESILKSRQKVLTQTPEHTKKCTKIMSLYNKNEVVQ